MKVYVVVLEETGYVDSVFTTQDTAEEYRDTFCPEASIVVTKLYGPTFNCCSRKIEKPYMIIGRR